MDEAAQIVVVRREVIRELLAQSAAIEPHHFQQKYSVTPGQLAAAIRELLIQGVVDFSAGRLRLTSEGKQWVYKHRLQIFTQPVNRYWRRPPEEVFKKRLGIHEPYMPASYRANKKFFDELLKKEE
jgi:hypothetical protein